MATVAPGEGPPKHVHKREDETYVVLAGRIDATIDDRTETLEIGDCVFLPPGISHALRNPGPDTAQMLMLVHPPGLEHVLEALARLRREGALTREVVQDLIAKYDAGELRGKS